MPSMVKRVTSTQMGLRYAHKLDFDCLFLCLKGSLVFQVVIGAGRMCGGSVRQTGSKRVGHGSIAAKTNGIKEERL